MQLERWPAAAAALAAALRRKYKGSLAKMGEHIIFKYLEVSIMIYYFEQLLKKQRPCSDLGRPENAGPILEYCDEWAAAGGRPAGIIPGVDQVLASFLFT